MTLETIQFYANYWVYIVLMMIGMYAMIAKNNLIKKLVGMTIFQTAIILFYVSTGVKEGAQIPILSEAQAHVVHHADGHGEGDGKHEGDKAHAESGHGGEDGKHEGDKAHAESGHGEEEEEEKHGDSGHAAGQAHAAPPVHAKDFANPIPHVLMLTAIVVGVSTLGVALAIVQRIYAAYGTIEEDEILEQIRPGAHD